ncbi:Protein GrpE [Nitrospira japonica]|uniref:Protein GrpE n=1 Tax=Nitrospira japonica TaxID=1325564 RepID=A0A1W1I808_9BACT|nr:nucleotide exchange factor GrpE [Nitrospira japonica]SLM49136.1 Protein GrpE [Nitrospira japonica]
MSEKDKKINIIDNLDEEPVVDFSEESGEALESVLQKALAAKSEELKALNDKYLRQAAEFDNYKRLAQRDQREQIKFGNEQLLKELLPTVDNLERAIKAAKTDKSNESLIQGVDLTLKQVLTVLGRFGVQAIDTVGKPFDPSAHQAVASVPSDTVPPEHVVEEFQRGYRLHDRILRAAMVTVSTGRAADDAN